MVAHRKPIIRKRVQITFTDREAIRLVAEEAARTGEPMGSVASRCIIRYYAMVQVKSN